jgi:hypothetical protein
MDNDLQQGIAAAKAGDKLSAFNFLTRASQVPETAEQAWLWLSSVVDDDSERLFCLDNVLRINAHHPAAQRGAAMLRQKRIFPAMPVYPEPKRNPFIERDFSSQEIPSPEPYKADLAPPTWAQTSPASTETSKSQSQSNYESERKKEQLSGLFQYAVMELSSNKPDKVVEKLLVDQGALPETAKTIIQDARYLIRKGHRAKYKKRMTRGFLVIIVGIVLTCGTYTFAYNFGGSYFLFYGAIIYGLIDFAIGLIGWLANG